MNEIGPQLIVHGPLGLMTLVLAYAVKHLYQALEKERDRHKAEMQALMERHIGKAETWVEKGNELARSLHEVLASLARRLPPDETRERESPRLTRREPP